MEITVADDISAEYRGLVQSILDNPEFKKLQRYKQHFQTTRFMHSLNVSYISYSLPKSSDGMPKQLPGPDFFMTSVFTISKISFPKGKYRPTIIPEWPPAPAKGIS